MTKEQFLKNANYLGQTPLFSMLSSPFLIILINLRIFLIFSYLQKYGITTDACYPYGSIITGDEYSCQSKCQDGSAITEVYKATYTNLTSTNQVKDYLLYEGPVVVLIEGNKEAEFYKKFLL